MFNQISVNLDHVEFEYIEGGRLYCVNVGKPDGVSYSQWSGAWDAFKKFLDSRQPTLSDYVERQIDTSEIESLEDWIGDLEEENRVLRRDLDAAEDANADLEKELDEVRDELSELKFRMEGLDK